MMGVGDTVYFCNQLSSSVENVHSRYKQTSLAFQGFAYRICCSLHAEYKFLHSVTVASCLKM